MIWLILFILQLNLIYFLPLNVTSGDGAELVTSIALNGIAHPSGYPLYTILCKLFTFLPIGTIAFRVSLFSSICTIASLYMMHKILSFFSKSNISSFFAIISLYLSYSFFYQSLFQKFYTLNLLMILILLYIGIYVIKKGYEKNLQFLVFFLLGLFFSFHHSGLLMVIPFTLLAILYLKDFLKNIFPSIIFFISGAITNIYIFIKLHLHSFTFFPMDSNFKSVIFNYIFRGIYKDESSLSLIKSSIYSIKSYFYTLKNMIKIIQTNFPLYFTYLFFIAGCMYLYKKNKKIFLFFLLSFITYSIILGKLTFSMQYPTVFDYYIYANQYFLPMLSIYAILSGIGFYFIVDFTRKRSKIVFYILTFIPFFYLILYPIRLKDNLWSKNLAVYQSRVDKLFTKPINSIYITKGDNPVFQTTYLKNIANFRNDICQIMYFKNAKSCPISCFLDGKKKDIYKIFSLRDFINRHYVMGEPLIFSTENLKTYLIYFFPLKVISDYLIIYKGEVIKKHDIFNNSNSCNIGLVYDFLKDESNLTLSDTFTKKILTLQKTFKKFYNYQPCLEHSTDDYFTYGNCYAAYVRNNLIDNKIKEKLIKYNSALMPYILNDENLKKQFLHTVVNEIQ